MKWWLFWYMFQEIHPRKSGQFVQGTVFLREVTSKMAWKMNGLEEEMRKKNGDQREQHVEKTWGARWRSEVRGAGYSTAEAQRWGRGHRVGKLGRGRRGCNLSFGAHVTDWGLYSVPFGNLGKWYRWTYLQGRNRDTIVENKHVDTKRGEGGGGMN